MKNQIFNESCLDTMSRMGDCSIDLAVTSPPYDNLRSYGNDVDQTWGESVWKPIVSLGSEINEDYFKISQKRLSQTQEYFF